MIDFSSGIDIRVAFAAMDKMGYDPDRSVELQHVDEWQHVFCEDVDVVLCVDPFGKREYGPSKSKALAEKIDEILHLTKLSENAGRIDVLVCSSNGPYMEWLEHYDNHELLDEVVSINKPTTEETPVTLTETIKLHSLMDRDSTALNILVQSGIYIENLQKNACDSITAEKAKRMLLDTNTLLITGPNSFDMSVLGAHLMKSYHPKECLVLTDPTEWIYVPLSHDTILKKRSHLISVVMVENFSGRSNFSLANVDKWFAKFDLMYAAVQSGKLKVIITCTSDHTNKIDPKLQAHGLFLSKISLSKKKKAISVPNVKIEQGSSLEATEVDIVESSDENDYSTAHRHGLHLIKEQSHCTQKTKCMYTVDHRGTYSLKLEGSIGPCQIVSCCQGPNDTFFFCDKRNKEVLLTDSIYFRIIDNINTSRGSAIVYPFMDSQEGALLRYRQEVNLLSLFEMEISRHYEFRHFKDNCVTLSCSQRHSYLLTNTGDVYVYNTSFTHVLTIETRITGTYEWPHQRMAVDENGTNIYVGGARCVKCFDQFGNKKWSKKNQYIDKTILLAIANENVLVFNTLTKRILEITPTGVMQQFLDIPDTYGVPSAFCFTKDMSRLIMPELDTDNLHVFTITETQVGKQQNAQIKL